jgi:hypothetical protein
VQRTIPNRNCEICARKRRPLMRSSVDSITDESGRYLLPKKFARAS